MFGFFARNTVSVLCVILFAFNGPTGVAADEMTKALFCEDGTYAVRRSPSWGYGPRVSEIGSLEDLRANLHKYEGAQFSVHGHFFPWNPVERAGDMFDGHVGPHTKCVFKKEKTYAYYDKLDRMVPVAVYKEDVQDYEQIKKMVIHNTDEIWSRNRFNISGNVVYSKEYDTLYLRVKKLAPRHNWQPYPKTKNVITRENFEKWLLLSPEQRQIIIDDVLDND